MKKYNNLKPFSLEWWLFYKEYARDMWMEVDNVTDECAMNGRCGHSKEMCDMWWKQWHKYTELEEWIRQRIIKEFSGQKPE